VHDVTAGSAPVPRNCRGSPYAERIGLCRADFRAGRNPDDVDEAEAANGVDVCGADESGG
jgi:hypothetical protein